MKTVDKFNNIVTLSPDQYKRDGMEAKQEVLSVYSSFVEKIAFPVLFLVIGILFSLGWILQYPQILQARATITGTNGDASVVTLAVDLPQVGGVRPDAGQVVDLFFDRLRNRQTGAQEGRIRSVSAVDGNRNVNIVVCLAKRQDIDLSSAVKCGEKTDVLITIRNMKLYERFFHDYRQSGGGR